MKPHRKVKLQMTYSTFPTVTEIQNPLAIEKIKVARHLAKSNGTVDDLPDGFWNETDRAVRDAVYYGVIAALNDKKRAARRLAKMADYPADYGQRSYDQKMRIGSAVRTRRWRAKRKAAAPVMQRTTITSITREWISGKLALLGRWTTGTTPLARQCRGRERELVKAATYYQMLSDKFGRQASHGELAGKLGCTRRSAQNRIRILTALYSGGGPWHSKA
jgi:hypothetical protein